MSHNLGRYDNSFTNMFGHVRVSGPGFRKIPFVENFNATMNTELYNLFSSLLGYPLLFPFR